MHGTDFNSFGISYMKKREWLPSTGVSHHSGWRSTERGAEVKRVVKWGGGFPLSAATVGGGMNERGSTHEWRITVEVKYKWALASTVERNFQSSPDAPIITTCLNPASKPLSSPLPHITHHPLHVLHVNWRPTGYNQLHASHCVSMSPKITQNLQIETKNGQLRWLNLVKICQISISLKCFDAHVVFQTYPYCKSVMETRFFFAFAHDWTWCTCPIHFQIAVPKRQNVL